jgi:hypothetical protein
VGLAHAVQKALPIQFKQFWNLQTQAPLYNKYPLRHAVHWLLLLQVTQLGVVHVEATV